MCHYSFHEGYQHLGVIIQRLKGRIILINKNGIPKNDIIFQN